MLAPSDEARSGRSGATAPINRDPADGFFSLSRDEEAVRGLRRRSPAGSPMAAGHRVRSPERRSSPERVVRRRRRFAVQLSPVALLLVAAGVALGSGRGLLHVVGLAAVAYGVGLAVALVWLAAGHNPIARR
jgi:hypothetical protein